MLIYQKSPEAVGSQLPWATPSGLVMFRPPPGFGSQLGESAVPVYVSRPPCDSSFSVRFMPRALNDESRDPHASLLLIGGDFVRAVGALEVSLDLAGQLRRRLRLRLDRDGRVVGEFALQLFLGLLDLQAIADVRKDRLAVGQPAVLEMEIISGLGLS